MRFQIEDVDNGWVVTKLDTGLPKQMVFLETDFDKLISYIAYNFGELEIDEKFVLTKEKE